MHFVFNGFSQKVYQKMRYKNMTSLKDLDKDIN